MAGDKQNELNLFAQKLCLKLAFGCLSKLENEDDVAEAMSQLILANQSINSQDTALAVMISDFLKPLLMARISKCEKVVQVFF